MEEEISSSKRLFPNIATPSVTLHFFLGGLIIALVLTVARNSELNLQAWRDFLTWAAFTQTVALCGIITVKIIAKPLQKVGLVSGFLATFVTLLLVTVGVYEVLLFLLHFNEITTSRWPDDHTSTLVRLVIVSAVIIAMTLRYSIVHQGAQLRNETQKQDRLQALQSRIRPHFLFNSMNSVASLIRPDPDLAEKALQDLADVFRTLLADARKMVPITAEGELARQYLDIEKLRLGDRLQVKWTASNVPRSALIPSLTLQPLLENAVYHGIEPSVTGGTIDIHLWSEGEMLKILISNPLPETSDQTQQRKGNRMAVDNVRERLSQSFGGRASLENVEQQGNYHVKISMPIIRG